MIKLLLSIILLTFSFPLVSSAPQPFTNEAALTLANHLAHRGELRERDGFVYIKVDDRFIHDIFPLLTQPQIKKPAYFRRADAPGAHISVFYETESKKIGSVAEIGMIFNFEVIELRSVAIQKGKDVFLIAVKAPELEALRRKYGLQPLLQGHDFHITVAIRQTQKIALEKKTPAE